MVDRQTARVVYVEGGTTVVKELSGFAISSTRPAGHERELCVVTVRDMQGRVLRQLNLAHCDVVDVTFTWPVSPGG